MRCDEMSSYLLIVFLYNLVRGLENCLHDSNLDVITQALHVLGQAQNMGIPMQTNDRISLMSVLCGKLLHGKSDAIGQSASGSVRHFIQVRFLTSQ